MEGRMYAVTFSTAVSALQDLFEFSAADDEPIKLHELYLSQSSDFGDAEEEGLRYAVIRGNTTSGSGGTAPTPVALDPKVGAAAFSAEVNNTTEASAGTEVTLREGTFYTRVGEVYIPVPSARPKTDQGTGLLVVRLLEAPADALTVQGTAIIEEG